MQSQVSISKLFNRQNCALSSQQIKVISVNKITKNSKSAKQYGHIFTVNNLSSSRVETWKKIFFNALNLALFSEPLKMLNYVIFIPLVLWKLSPCCHDFLRDICPKVWAGTGPALFHLFQNINFCTYTYWGQKLR